MGIIKQENLFSLLKNSHILLDTNLLIDLLIKPSVFNDFFNELKDNGVTITTIAAVAIEFLQGAGDLQKYNEKKEILDQVIDSYIPISPDVFENIFKLVKRYGIASASPSMTDFLLGATLMKYSKNLFLFTKNTTDFPQDIFELVSVINFPTSKSIQTYGVYVYK